MNTRRNKKGFLDISFSWIFAFLVGAMILVGAIYGVNKFTSVKDSQNSAELGVALKNFLTPLETGVEGTKSIKITLPVDSKIIHFCDSTDRFGKETFSVQEKRNDKWTASGVPASFNNKYVLLPRITEGKTFSVFSKTFDFPFNVANLIYFTNSKEKYCFVGFPLEVKSELKNLNQDNLEFNTCSNFSKKICFDTPSNNNCEIKIDSDQKSVEKDGEKVYYEGNALMYAAIFSDKDIYECETKRLMKRADELAKIYQEKTLSLVSKGCTSTLDLSTFKSEVSIFQDSANLSSIEREGQSLDRLNRYSDCKLW